MDQTISAASTTILRERRGGARVSLPRRRPSPPRFLLKSDEECAKMYLSFSAAWKREKEKTRTVTPWGKKTRGETYFGLIWFLFHQNSVSFTSNHMRLVCFVGLFFITNFAVEKRKRKKISRHFVFSDLLSFSLNSVNLTTNI